MESSLRKAIERKKKRVFRIRKKISGTAEQPRVCVTKTNKQMFVQLIDDQKRETIVSLTSLSKDLKESKSSSCNVEIAKKMGTIIATKTLEKGIKRAVLDRRGNKYHGQIAALTDALREKGIQI